MKEKSTSSHNAFQTLNTIFSQNITVKNISNSLDIVTFLEADQLYQSHNYDYHLVALDDDLVVYDAIKKSHRPVKHSDIISESTPMIEVLEIIQDRAFVFVNEGRQIRGIVTKADINAIPVKIWLFGLISLFEGELKKFIVNYLNSNWENLLSEGRRAKIHDLYILKQQQNLETTLIDCTMITDLSQIIQKSSELSKILFSEDSKNQLKTIFNRITLLRNDLAHAIDIKYDWKETHELTQFILKRLDIIYNN